MSVNSSSSNASLPPSSFPSLDTHDILQICISSKVGTFNITGITIAILLIILPPCIWVLYLGIQQWQQERSKTTSHSNIFTYHTVVLELISAFGFTLICCGVYTDLPQMMTVGFHLFSANICGQLYFHILTCVDRYLAVVHPVTYLSLRKEKGIRIRNVTIGCAWLLCIAFTGHMYIKWQLIVVIYFFFTTVMTIILVSFCSISVLCVLIRPGPGDGCGARQRVDQTKLRAFYTMMAILGVLLFRFGGNIISSALYASPQMGLTGKCGGLFIAIWFCLPSSLLLPLLFLKRAQKRLCCTKIHESEQGAV